MLASRQSLAAWRRAMDWGLFDREATGNAESAGLRKSALKLRLAPIPDVSSQIFAQDSDAFMRYKETSAFIREPPAPVSFPPWSDHVLRSISALSSAPSSTTLAEIQSHIMSPATAPKEPYVAL
jgi:hypothetical protein